MGKYSNCKSKRVTYSLIIIILICGVLICACRKEDEPKQEAAEQTIQNTEEAEERLNKGYDLPIDKSEREAAVTDLNQVMELISNVYVNADESEAVNGIISNETISRMKGMIKETKRPVISSTAYSDMENYEVVETFLKDSTRGTAGSVIFYEIYSNGGVGRNKFIFDGTDMYAMSTNASWKDDYKLQITYMAYNRIKEWNYTEKGWFSYDMCVPEPPEVTEVINGSHIVRVKPMKEEYRKLSEACVLPMGYRGNNLLRSDWSTAYLDKLDYNGMYEYLYYMRYQKRFSAEELSLGIPKEEFENLIKTYIPVTTEQLQKYAAFDPVSQMYLWDSLEYFDYTSDFLETSMPEVIDIKDNEDGTVTLVVDAVGDMILDGEALMTHELTVRFSEDGSFQYLGNKIIGHENGNLSDYTFRISYDD